MPFCLTRLWHTADELATFGVSTRAALLFTWLLLARGLSSAAYELRKNKHIPAIPTADSDVTQHQHLEWGRRTLHTRSRYFPSPTANLA